MVEFARVTIQGKSDVDFEAAFNNAVDQAKNRSINISQAIEQPLRFVTFVGNEPSEYFTRVEFVFEI